MEECNSIFQVTRNNTIVLITSEWQMSSKRSSRTERYSGGLCYRYSSETVLPYYQKKYKCVDHIKTLVKVSHLFSFFHYLVVDGFGHALPKNVLNI